MSSIDSISHPEGRSFSEVKHEKRSREKLSLKGLSAIEKRSLIEKRAISSPRTSSEQRRHSKLVVELSQSSTDLAAPPVFSFSPRASPQAITEIANEIQKILGSDYPSGLAYIFSQIVHNQYVFVSSEYEELALELCEQKWIGPFFLAIDQLSDSKTSLSKIRLRRLWEAALKVLLCAEARKLAMESPFKEAIERIFSKAEQMKSPKFCELTSQTKQILKIDAGKSIKGMAKTGLKLLFQNISSNEGKEILGNLKLKYQHDPLLMQNFFLSAAKIFLFGQINEIWAQPCEKQYFAQLTIQVLIGLHQQAFPEDPTIQYLIKHFLNPMSFKELAPLKSALSSLIKPHSIPARWLGFMLFWIQHDFTDADGGLDLIAGTREWDAEGQLFYFATHRFLDLHRKLPYDAELLSRWIHFFHCYRKAPANRDVIEEPLFSANWFKILEVVANHSELKQILGDVFLAEFSRAKISPRNYDPLTFYFNPLYSLPPVSSSFWERGSAVSDLQKSILFYLLSSYGEITVSDLVSSSKAESTSISNYTKRFNQVFYFFVEHLLACQSEAQMQQIVKTLCSLQKELLANFAFEAASILHAVFQQASITRLNSLFSELDNYYELFEDPDTLCARKANAKKLRLLQSEHPESFEIFSLVLQDLTHMRDNPYELTEDGRLNLDRLKQIGALYNNFSARKNSVLTFWASAESLVPSPFLIQNFTSQSGLENEELEIKWYKRSHEILPPNPKAAGEKSCN